ncbi:unnamed protein product [Fusarium venenatum]|uniref:Uncharacterized protein n=1 Tax=Fusarium venenatum TaxID=56646 RepID=A0A2L2U2C5_9HYPO|nr:uncharacterized protein FVRRES_09777 [Fusarium venenatum]CEI69700.1 unnamed protein product [Fusarium venenatum]
MQNYFLHRITKCWWGASWERTPSTAGHAYPVKFRTITRRKLHSVSLLDADKFGLNNPNLFPISSTDAWRWDEAITTCVFPPSRAQSNVVLTGLQGAGRDPVEEAWCVEAQHAFHSTNGSFVPLHQARFSNDCRTWLFGVVHQSILSEYAGVTTIHIQRCDWEVHT